MASSTFRKGDTLAWRDDVGAEWAGLKVRVVDVGPGNRPTVVLLQVPRFERFIRVGDCFQACAEDLRRCDGLLDI